MENDGGEILFNFMIKVESFRKKNCVITMHLCLFPLIAIITFKDPSVECYKMEDIESQLSKYT